MKMKCSGCEKTVNVRKDVFEKRLQKYNVKTKDELEKVYLCKKCRKEQSNQKHQKR